MHAIYACMHWSAETLNIYVPTCFLKYHAKYHENPMSNLWEFKFYMKNGLVLFGLAWFFCGLDY